MGQPINFVWNKCVRNYFGGHGITTTPLQAASIYAQSQMVDINQTKLIKPEKIKNMKD